MDNLYKHLQAVKVVDMKMPHALGYTLLSGFGLLDTQRNELVKMGGDRPYVLKRKKDIQTIVDSGLIGAPEIYKITKAQRSCLVV